MRSQVIAVIILLLLLSCLAEAKKKPAKERVKVRERIRRGEKEQHAHFLTPDKPEFWLNVLLATCSCSLT